MKPKTNNLNFIKCNENMDDNLKNFLLDFKEALFKVQFYIENDEYVQEQSKKPTENISKTKQKKEKTFNELLNILKKSILGQEKQVEELLTSIYKQIRFPELKSNILILGPSGSGKTASIKIIADNLNLPYTIEDATQYTEEGYIGESISSMLCNLLIESDFDLKAAETGMLIIDEIDKKSGKASIGRDVSGTNVLQSLLKIIEGGPIKLPEKFIYDYDLDFNTFDTSNLKIILLGAFDGLTKQIEEGNKQSIGFNQNIIKKSINDITKEDIIKYGMPREFVGRISTIISMNKLTESDLANIVRTSKISFFKKYIKIFKDNNIKLTFSNDLYNKIAKKAIKSNTGARELNNIIDKLFEKVIFTMLSTDIKGYSKCKLNNDILENNFSFKFS